MRRTVFTRALVFALLASLFTAGALAPRATAGHLPVVTGEHWVKASEGERLAYLLGMGTIIELEKEYQGEKPIAESLNHKLVKGLHDHTFREIKQHLDNYYKQNPGQLDRPVVEVIWYELVAPDLEHAK